MVCGINTCTKGVIILFVMAIFVAENQHGYFDLHIGLLEVTLKFVCHMDPK